jgi:hypothetical protein
MSYYDDWVDPNAFFPTAMRRRREELELIAADRQAKEERGRREGRQCPYCGAWRVGLEDHIRVKHPEA